MSNNDTVELLRECSSGVKMSLSAIDEVLPKVTSGDLEALLTDCKSEHENLGTEILQELAKHDGSDKEPNAMAKSMSWIKTNVAIALDNNDATIAELMTDGCGMGIKSLARYINQYKSADRVSKDMAQRLIESEEQFVKRLRKYL